MVAGLREPDIVREIIAHFRADADVAGYVGNRIANVFPEGDHRWPMPLYAILVRRAGGLAPNMTTNEHSARIDVLFYGAGKTPAIRRRTADELYQVANPVLSPPAQSGQPAGWKSGRLIVSSADPEGEPLSAMEPQTDWPLVICSYRVKYTWMLP